MSLKSRNTRIRDDEMTVIFWRHSRCDSSMDIVLVLCKSLLISDAELLGLLIKTGKTNVCGEKEKKTVCRKYHHNHKAQQQSTGQLEIVKN